MSGHTPGRRLEELATRLEDAERRAFAAIETQEQSDRRRGHPVLGFLNRAVILLRRLARQWDRRGAAGLAVPRLGRLRKGDARRARPSDYADELLALLRWCRSNGLFEEFLRDTKLFPKLIGSFAGGHTTCTCSVCGDGGPMHWTCQSVAVCRSGVTLLDLMSNGRENPVGELVRTTFEVMNALREMVAQIRVSDPEIGLRLRRLIPGTVKQMLNESEFSTSYGLECAVLILDGVAAKLGTYGQVHCDIFMFSLRDFGVLGPGAPEQMRAAEQHLENGGLQFVNRRGRLSVASLGRGPSSPPKDRDRRIRFIRAKATT